MARGKKRGKRQTCRHCSVITPNQLTCTKLVFCASRWLILTLAESYLVQVTKWQKHIMVTNILLLNCCSHNETLAQKIRTVRETFELTRAKLINEKARMSTYIKRMWKDEWEKSRDEAEGEEARESIKDPETIASKTLFEVDEFVKHPRVRLWVDTSCGINLGPPLLFAACKKNLQANICLKLTLICYCEIYLKLISDISVHSCFIR